MSGLSPPSGLRPASPFTSLRRAPQPHLSHTARWLWKGLDSGLCRYLIPAFAERRRCQSVSQPCGVGGRHSEVKGEVRCSRTGGHERSWPPAPHGRHNPSCVLSEAHQQKQNPPEGGFLHRCERTANSSRQSHILARQALGQAGCQTVGQTVDRQLRVGANAGREQ